MSAVRGVRGVVVLDVGVRGQVTYTSDCPNGGSSFTATIKKKAHMEIGVCVCVSVCVCVRVFLSVCLSVCLS